MHESPGGITSKLKILFVARHSLYSQPGGDTVQIDQTARYIRKFGHTVDIYTGKELKNPSSYDIFHFFNLGRPSGVMPLLKYNKPLIISSIYVDYSPSSRGSALLKLLGKHRLEYLKAVARWINGSDNFPGWQYLFKGQKASILTLLKRASAVIAASRAEIERIESDFGRLKDACTIPLGVEHLQPAAQDEPGKSIRDKDLVLSVGRIEKHKNQEYLIKAINDTNLKLRVVGKPATNQAAYHKSCQNVAGANISFEGYLTGEALLLNYREATVHALPSYSETTGLSNLEALLHGCSIVVGDNPIEREIFGDNAHYCNPSDPLSIKEAVMKAREDASDRSAWVKENFSWDRAAKKITDIYHNLSSTPA